MAGKHPFRPIAVLASLTLFLAGCASSTTGNAQAGAQLFSSKCIGCHQTNGVGSTSSIDLTQDLAEANYDLLKYELTHPSGPQANLRHFNFTPQQIRDLNAFAVSDLKPRHK